MAMPSKNLNKSANGPEAADERDEGEKEPTRKICWYVYASHFLSAWGDRMWQFGVGLFLVIISPDSLRVTAVYGFASGGATLLFGPAVGRWVDRTSRLSAARISLVIQNLSVAICAAILWVLVTNTDKIKAFWSGQALLYVFYTLIILMAIVANLASIANTIAVEKDWIVVICQGDKNLFAATSATLKGVDLVTNILAPVLTGQVMTFGSVQAGALFIGGWNLVSVCVEFYLLKKVYDTVPALWVAKPQTRQENVSTSAETGSIGCTGRLFSGILLLFGGWKTYMKYDVVFAGLGLAFLYMTVLGFDNVTVGYAYTQGISESLMGILMALGAFIGILGTVAYPRVRRQVGQVRCGLIGFMALLTCLLLCVASIWAPGSSFDIHFRSRDKKQTNNDSMLDARYFTSVTAVPSTKNELSATNVSDMQIAAMVTKDSDSQILPIIDYSTSLRGYMMANSTSDLYTGAVTTTDLAWQTFISVGLLLTGIVGTRFGLWMTDLTITQLFLDHVTETERGVVLGVQTSLNQLMDMIKFALVIALPEPEVFGILILTSFVFSVTGFALYARFSYVVRGHILPFHAVKRVSQVKDYTVLCEDSDFR